ncbi:MAG: redoxin family protein [Armatimonas sp.]
MLRFVLPLVAALSLTLGAQAAPLKMGSAAPAIKVAKWVKGTPVSKFEKGKFYVVEFWATWCGPCRISIPHLTELAKKYKGKVSFTGVSISEDDPKYATKVAAFVKKMGTTMNYNVAIDTLPRSGFMSKNWMDAAGQGGIPTAFIVDKNQKIAWIGHPMEMDGPLAKIVAGTYDPKVEIAKQEKQQALMGAMQKVQALMRQGKPTEALAALDKVMVTNPEMAEQLASLRFNLLLTSDEAKAYDYARTIGEGVGKNNPLLLNAIAWTMLDNKELKSPDFALALTLAEKADALTKNNDWQILDTLALAQFKNDKKSEALATQTKAVALLKADSKAPAEFAKELTDRLEMYKKAQ